MNATISPSRDAADTSVFDCVVAGVDGSESGFEAARQASRLVAPDGRLEIFTAVHLAEATLAGPTAPRLAAELEREAGEAARKGAQLAGPRAETRFVNGPPLATLMRELEEQDTTLAVVGTHGHSRVSELLLGGMVGELLHDAPCSVLVARPPAVDALFPRAIVAGVDGSPESAAAVATAQYLAERFAVPLTVITALGGRYVDLVAAQRLAAVETVIRHPVQALVDAGADADIVVVGSRGLHGLRSLGSVSERVAHRAPCSVLVVRPRGG
jgi:nucleotide-binding universal stress UspA family protein